MKLAIPLTSSVTPQKINDAARLNNQIPISSAAPISTTQIEYTKEPKEENSSKARISQRCIHLRFKRGDRTRKNDILEPKLMCRDVYHPVLVSKQKLNVSSPSRPNQICLLSICRIIETTQVDRKKYPFAKTNCSFVIRTCNQVILFEAKNEQE